MKFTEEKLEKAFAGLFGQEGFQNHLDITITSKPDEVLSEEDEIFDIFTKELQN